MKGRRYEGYVTIANDQNNIDNKIQTEKKYASMLPISIRGVICGPSNCGKKRLDKFIEKSWLRERAYSKSLQQSKYRYLEILLASIEEIGYFTFFNNSDGVPPNEALPNSIFVFDDVACDKHEAIREYFVMSDTRTSTASICVKRMQRYQSISYAIMQIC